MSTKTEDKIPIMQLLNQTPVVQIVALPDVGDRFQHIYQVMNGGDRKIAGLKYEAEKFHFMKLLQDNPGLKECTKLSLYGAFMDAAVNGLSFDPALKHLYVVSYNHKVYVVENNVKIERKEKRASIQISGQGELLMRMQQGQIKYADNPVLVYKGDKFMQGIKDNAPFISHEAVFPRTSTEIIACYLRITRIDGSIDFKVFSYGEIMNLKAFSKDPTSLAWTSGLPGMISTKTLKHAFKSYPKPKLGQFSKLITEGIDEKMKEIDYGLTGEDMAMLQTGVAEPGPEVYTEAEKEKEEPMQQNIPETLQEPAQVNDNDFAEAPKGKGKQGNIKFEDDNF